MRDLDFVIDLHVHCGPDVRLRKTTLPQLADVAWKAGMRGLLVKNHHCGTMLSASAVREMTRMDVVGGLALNEWSGGLNPAAVEAALRMGARQIGMPTLSAENERAYRGFPGTGIRVFDADDKLKPEVHEILQLIKNSAAILGTGHLSLPEIRAVVAAAREVGVHRILVNHPEIEFVRMPVSMQRDLAGPDLWFERCYPRENFTRDWDGLALDIREVGWQYTVLATDLGQADSIHPVDGFREMLRQYAKRGYTEEMLEAMSCHAPARVLGWD